MSDISKIKAIRILTSCTFWIPIIVLYLQSRNLETQQVFQLVSLYSILIVVFEFPTGVIGDHFSHKTSTTLGYLITGVATFMLGLNGGYIYYALLMVLGALGASLISGSDTAILHSVSKNFQKDYSHLRALSIIVSVIAIALGGVIADLSLSLPFFLSGTAFLIAMPFNIAIKGYQKEVAEGNIFATAADGVKATFKTSGLLSIVAFSSVVMGFFLSLKWFYNPYLEELQIPLYMWGFIISGMTLLSAVGTKLYEKNKKGENSILLILLPVFIGLIGFMKISIISLIFLSATFLLRGFIETKVEVALNSAITNKNRASVISFKNLIARLFSSIYVMIGGYVIVGASFTALMIGTGVLVFVAVVPMLVGAYTIRVKVSHTI